MVDKVNVVVVVVDGSVWNKQVYFFFTSKVHYTQSTNSIFLTKIICHLLYGITSNTGIFFSNLEEGKFSHPKKKKKEHKEKKWKLFSFYFKIREDRAVPVKNFLSNQLFFRNFLVLYFSTCCKNDDVLENLMVQTVDVRMNVVCKPINQKYYSIYIIFILNFIYQPACSFFVKKIHVICI